MLTKRHKKYLSGLKQKKNRNATKEFLAEGLRLCEELVDSTYQVEEIFFSKNLCDNLRGQKLISKAKNKSIPVFEVATDILKSICTTKTPSSIVARAKQKEHIFNGKIEGKRFLVLDNVSNPGNIGTLIRTAEAFSWNAIFLLGDGIELYNPKVVRGTMGSLFRLPIFYTSIPTIMSCFEDMNVSYVVTSVNNGKIPSEIKISEKMVLFLGSEAHGVSDEVEKKAHYKIQIPTQHVESLNIAIAGGILLFLYKHND